MTTRGGYAVLAALIAFVALVSVSVYALTGDGDGDAAAESRAGQPSTGAAAPASTGSWAGTWAAAPAGAEPGTRDGFAGSSIRNVVHTSVGGARARIQLSNEYGAAPLTVSHVTLAVAAPVGAPAAQPATMRRLSFGGSPSVTIPAGAAATSDPVRLRVPQDADLLVSTYVPVPAGPVTYHPHARQTSYLAAGEHTRDLGGAAYTRVFRSWRYLTAVDVWGRQATGSVAVVGDSLTDGTTSTLGANRRWTDYLAVRLREEPDAPRYGVLNLGLSGNRLLTDGGTRWPANGPSGLARLDRDALSRTGVEAVVVELGINDILKPPHETDPEAIITGLHELTARARARGLRVLGTTLMPFKGHPAHTPRLERVRRQVNERIRAGGVFDAVIDTDAVLRDPKRPKRLLPAYDSGDHLHLTDMGYRAMAQAVDVPQLKGGAQAAL